MSLWGYKGALAGGQFKSPPALCTPLKKREEERGMGEGKEKGEEREMVKKIGRGKRKGGEGEEREMGKKIGRGKRRWGEEKEEV